ncbi:MAG: pyridoxal 5'-phosphate synthase glutaminase subunit PdxT, partial [Hadesarchaea archaeon]|nr:pyridoxal 5'-phosphate synthase glutaminase subunit PdxT [Hadesarchaea archaeon]
MRVGVLGLQGAVSEHLSSTSRAMKKLGMRGEVVWVSRREHLEGLEGLILPGGESTTIGRLLLSTGLLERIREEARNGLPLLGTCAGLILLASEGDEEVRRTGQPLLGLMDMKVIRNAFGRQRESFEADVRVEGLRGGPFRGVFIRAPVVERVWGEARVVAELEGRIVGVRQGKRLAFSFHPEL